MARILVVDDDPGSLEPVCKYLQQGGYTVECQPNGREALKAVLRSTPDLVILDLQMPEMDGCGLLEILRSYLRLRTLPVIVLSGFREGPMIDRARNFKVKSVLLKGKATLDEIGQAVKLELRDASK